MIYSSDLQSPDFEFLQLSLLIYLYPMRRFFLQGQLSHYISRTVALLLVFIIGWQVYQQGRFLQGNIRLSELLTDGKIWLLCSLLLVIVNWWIEIVKWRLLIKNTSNHDWLSSTRSVLGGVALGMITPARLGEIPGRAFLLSQQNRTALIAKALFSSLIQNSWNIALGGIAILYLGTNIAIPGLEPSIIGWVFFCQLLLLFALVYYVDQLPFLFMKSRFSFLREWSGKLNLALTSTKWGIRWQIWGLSGLRYLAYLLQYIIIMNWLVPGASLVETGGVAAVQFMLQSLLPLPAVLSLPARGEMAVLCWGALDVKPVYALLGTGLMWLFNLGLPAITGVLFLFCGKIEKRLFP